MNWPLFILVLFFMSLTANVFLVYIIRQVGQADNPLMDELRGSSEILRGENKVLHTRIEMMASSVPHIRLIHDEEEAETATVSPLLERDDDGNIVGHKGAGVV
jgi:hypothetical protein